MFSLARVCLAKNDQTHNYHWAVKKNYVRLSPISRLTELCLKILVRAAKAMAAPDWTGLFMPETRARTVGCSQQSPGFLQVLIINIHAEARLIERDHNISCAWFNKDLNSTVPNLWRKPSDRAATGQKWWFCSHLTTGAHRQWLVLNLIKSSQRKSEGGLESTGASAAEICKD